MSPQIQKPQACYDIVIIGAGPAGLAAARAASEEGVQSILLIERDQEGGGILNQCIHNGFGLHRFKEELTGPEYAAKDLIEVEKTSVDFLTDSMVLEISPDKKLKIANPQGYHQVQARAIILAMGCRERTRGAIALPGTRPAGVLTAGAAQRYVNVEGHFVGKKIVILGSGDIGLIMARRMSWSGAEVLACVERLPYPGGLTRNIVQCLEDFSIPLYLQHTVIDIRGQERLTGCTIAKVDEKGNPIPGTEKDFDCDTLLLSVGLIPETELIHQLGLKLDPRTRGPEVDPFMQTDCPGIFACGNVVHVHDLVDFVSAESMRAGRAAARWLQKTEESQEDLLSIRTGETIGYTVPQKIDRNNLPAQLSLFFRVRKVYKNPVELQLKSGDQVLKIFRKPRLVPGEMEEVTLPTSLLSGIQEPLLLEVKE